MGGSCPFFLKNCYFSVFILDAVRKAFGVVEWEGRKIEPRRLLLEESEVSLIYTQGIGLWVALKAQWKIRCAVKFQRQKASLGDFVALWAGLWRAGGVRETCPAVVWIRTT